jgi:hypothetical protein
MKAMEQSPKRRSRADAAESVFTWGVFVFVIARAALVWKPLQDGSVNPYIFLALDVLTAYPYAKSWPRLFRSVAARRADGVAFWAAVLLGSLVAPYLYVFVFIAALASAVMRLRRGLSYEPRHGAPSP